MIKIFIILFATDYVKSSTSFFFNQKPREKNCFQEYFADNTLVTFQVTSNSTIKVVIFDPQNNVMIDKSNTTNIKHAFTTFEGGQFSLCVLNQGDILPNKVDFTMKFGIAAKDYSEVAKKKDLKPVELNLQKLDDKTGELMHLLTYAATHENVNAILSESLVDKIATFSLILLGMMILIGFLETIYLRNYLMNKKLI